MNLQVNFNKNKTKEGIEFFISLKFLTCVFNQLTELDLSFCFAQIVFLWEIMEENNVGLS